MTSEELQSKVIAWLRFVLIAGVLLMHTYSTGSYADSGWFAYIYLLVSKIIAHSSVPAFFFISGYLFFYKTDFSKTIWLDKLKKRTRSLLIPYLFWITVWLVAYYALYKTPLAGLLHISANGTPGYTPGYLLAAYWCLNGSADYETFPLVGQFWFIRDLMVVVLLSPAIWLLLKKIPTIFLSLIGIFWLFDGHFPLLGIESHNIPIVGPFGLSHTVLFFFSLGAIFSLNKKLFTEEIWKLRHFILPVYPLLVVALLFYVRAPAKEWAYDLSWLHRLTVFVGVFFFINLAYWLLRTGRANVNAFLASASFFVFAFHQEWLRLPAKKIFLDAINPQTDVPQFLCYAGHFLFYVFGALAVYYVLKRIFPRFTSIISGGR